MKAARDDTRPDLRRWQPVPGVGHGDVVVIRWGRAFCSVRLTADVLRDGQVCPERLKLARPWMARPEELTAVRHD